ALPCRDHDRPRRQHGPGTADRPGPRPARLTRRPPCDSTPRSFPPCSPPRWPAPAARPMTAHRAPRPRSPSRCRRRHLPRRRRQHVPVPALKVALPACISIVVSYYGTWAADAEVCPDGDDLAPLVVRASPVEFYESTCEVLAVEAGDGRIDATLQLTGEGETW